ncbi:MAG: endonuclease/exonuclease/phosphatase family protein [Methylobacter sp.]
MNLLFWNTNRKQLSGEIKSLCDCYDVDVLILAENQIKDAELLPILNENNDRTFIAPYDLSKKISFYTRIHDFELVHDDNWGSIRKLVHPLGIEILLVAVHIQSKLHADEKEQAFISARIAREIDRREQEQGHTRTIVIGDFNMNPFEAGLVCADGFHGVMDKHIALKQYRTVSGEKKKYFYNPMWSRLGDDSEGRAGTYYYKKSRIIDYFWNTLDQVLLRPSLLSCFTQHNLKVIDKIDEVSLIKNGTISNQFSDHLPLMVKLTMSQFSGDK